MIFLLSLVFAREVQLITIIIVILFDFILRTNRESHVEETKYNKKILKLTTILNNNNKKRESKKQASLFFLFVFQVCVANNEQYAF